MKMQLVNPQKLGKFGEDRARWFFKENSFENVHKLETKKVFIKKYNRVVHTGGTPCDFICSIPQDGFWLPAFIEVKLCDSDKLFHSRLSDDQVKNFLSWHACNHWSFVLWVHKQDCIMFKYPTIEFRRGKSITLEKAKKIAWIKV